MAACRPKPPWPRSRGVALSETLLQTESAASLHPLAHLHDPGTIRARCAAILRSVEAGVSPSFTLDRSRLPAVAERVAALTLRRFPDLVIPFHSRWRHFEVGGVNRKAEPVSYTHLDVYKRQPVRSSSPVRGTVTPFSADSGKRPVT